MKKIAVLSDTHGLLRPEVLKVVCRCDAILHAGDFDTLAAAAELETIRPLIAVRGNNDREWADGLPLVRYYESDGVKFCLVHDRRDIPEELADTDIVVFGHSHRYFQEQRDGRLWLNPGGCGRRRFGLPLTMAVITIENKEYNIEKLEIIPG